MSEYDPLNGFHRHVLDGVLVSLAGRIILAELVKETPCALRRMLVEPDPVFLHDWNMTREDHDGLVRIALDMIS